MRNYIKLLISAAASFFAVSCGSDSVIQPPVSAPILVLPLRITSSAGSEVVIGKDPHGKVTMVTTREGVNTPARTEIYEYSSSGDLTAVTKEDGVRFLINREVPGRLNIVTVNNAGDSVGLNIYAYTGGRLSEIINHVPSVNGWSPENRYEFSYDSQGNLSEIKLFTIISGNAWKMYGSTVYSRYDQNTNNMPAYDLLNPVHNFLLPLILRENDRTFTGNPLEIVTYDGEGTKLITYNYEYVRDAAGKRTRRIGTAVYQNNLISADTLNYYYN